MPADLPQRLTADERRATLAATPSIDADHPAVQAFAAEHACGDDDRERAVALYLAVRDGFRYDPYEVELHPDSFRASRVLEKGIGYCVTKAVLLAAAARAVGIPARVGLADVRNHMTSPRLLELMGTDEFLFHGYAALHLDGAWVKATPAFNRTLCDRVGALPLDFDGRTDSLLQPLTRRGERHMEYLRDHGTFDDVPVDRLLTTWSAAYPTLRGSWQRSGPAFEDEAHTA